MRQYLDDFFELFSYPEESRKALMYAYNCIELDSKLLKEFNSLLEEYSADKNCDFRGMLNSMSDISANAGIHVYEGNLLLLVCLSKKLKEYYAEDKIDQQIWFTSMCDLKWKLDECRCVYGIHGTFVPGWYAGFFRMERFGFGKLQFEVISFKADYRSAELTLTPDSRVINVHIPRTGEKLDRESQRWAYGEAVKFFREREHLEKTVFVCHSWLLFPRNREVLSPQSNLYLFLSDYDIAEQGLNDDYSEVWRLFDVNYEGDVDKLPQNTSLRRAYADWIRKGQKTGWGYGVFAGYLSGKENA